MGIDDVSKTVNAVMWLVLGLTALVPLLAWRPPVAGGRARWVVAVVLGAICWPYNVGLLLAGSQPMTYVAGAVGLGLLLLGAVRLGKAREGVGSSAGGVLRQSLVFIALWSTVALVVFAASGFGGR